jgi:tetratricopeptide (TPR) repeat protein
LPTDKKIVTTNYDNAFEIAENNFRTRTATLGDDFGFRYLHNPQEFTLLKLHGNINRPNTMVLFPKDYNNLYEVKNEDTERILFYLQNLIFNKTILFIGCGMGDFQINNIFKKVQNLLGKYNDKKHYYLNVDKPNDSLKFLEHIKIDNHSEILTIIDELLKIKEDAENEKFADKRQAEEYKKQKEKVEEKMEILRQELAIKEDQIKRYELLSWEYLNKGLDYIYNEKYEEAVEQFKIATEFNSDNDSAFYNWGTALYELAKLKNDENLYRESLDKFTTATTINSNNDLAFNNWGGALLFLFAKTKEENILNKALEVCKKAYTINHSKSYNLSCCYARLKDKENALKYLEESFINKNITVEYVIIDEDWKNYLEDEDFKKLIEKYR